MRATALMLLFIALSSAACGRVSVHDAEVCVDLGAAGGHCANTLTDGSRDIPKAAWDIDRFGWFCMRPIAFTSTETALDQLCNETTLCDYTAREALRKTLERVHSLTPLAP